MQISTQPYGPMTMWETYDSNLKNVREQVTKKPDLNLIQAQNKQIHQNSLPVLEELAAKYKNAGQVLQNSTGNVRDKALSAFLQINESFKRAFAAMSNNKQAISEMRAITDVLCKLK